MSTIDLSKAFDRVPHELLLQHLDGKITNTFLRWLGDYLSHRTFRIRYGGNYSCTMNVFSGVPQGSIIGPYLFASYMSSLVPSSDNVCYIKYADDITVIQPLYTNNQDPFTDAELPHIKTWLREKGLVLNEQKTKRLFIMKKCHPIDFSTLVCDHHVKILGVLFSCDLKWNDHVGSVVKLCSSRLHLLRKLKGLLCVKDLISVYKSLVLSILLYASPVFVGLNSQLSEQLEKLQKRAHRIICGVSCGCDSFPSISSLRLQQAKNLLVNAERYSAHPLHTLVPDRLTRSRHLRQPFAMTARRYNSFFPHVCKLLNLD